jgi:hypothetical protein
VAVTAISALGLTPSAHVPHDLHAESRSWVEKNCYIDVWIEVLHALKLDPLPALAFTVGIDFEGDQFTFYKPPHSDLQALYGVRITELNVYRPLLEHAREHLGAGRLLFTEADAIHLPDTAGTDYQRQHTKTTIVLETVDPEQRRLGYFHNASYHQLSGADFEGVFRTAPLDPFVVPLFAELVRLDRLERHPPAELAARSRSLLARHLSRRPPVNPFLAFAERLDRELTRLQGEGIDAYHAWAFATLRQVGSGFELTAAYLRWLDAHEPGAFAAPAAAFDGISAAAKSFILKGARAVASRKPVDFSGMIASLRDGWDAGMAALSPYGS